MESETGDQLAKAQIDMSPEDDHSMRMGPVENVRDSQKKISLIGLRVHRMSIFSSAKKVDSHGISSRSIEA